MVVKFIIKLSIRNKVKVMIVHISNMSLKKAWIGIIFFFHCKNERLGEAMFEHEKTSLLRAFVV